MEEKVKLYTKRKEGTTTSVGRESKTIAGGKTPTRGSEGKSTTGREGNTVTRAKRQNKCLGERVSLTPGEEGNTTGQSFKYYCLKVYK